MKGDRNRLKVKCITINGIGSEGDKKKNWHSEIRFGCGKSYASERIKFDVYTFKVKKSKVRQTQLHRFCNFGNV